MAENINQARWISLQEVCDYLGVKRHPIMRCSIQCIMGWRFKTADIDEWIEKGGASDGAEGIK